MRYLFFVLALLVGISAAIAPVSDAFAGGDMHRHHCDQGGNDDSQGNEDCQ
jgi:hypothetical protein